MQSIQLDDVIWVQAPRWAVQLASRMDVASVQIGLKLGLLNAVAVRDGSVVLGVPLLAQISPSAIRPVVAHEFGHFKFSDSRYASWSMLLQGIALVRFTRALRGVHPILISLYGKPLTKALDVLMQPVRWMQEYGADAIAAEYVGRSAMISTLFELGKLQGSFTASGYDHPSIRNRVLFLLLFATPEASPPQPVS